jgi:hypothetical protein
MVLWGKAKGRVLEVTEFYYDDFKVLSRVMKGDAKRKIVELGDEYERARVEYTPLTEEVVVEVITWNGNEYFFEYYVFNGKEWVREKDP